MLRTGTVIDNCSCCADVQRLAVAAAAGRQMPPRAFLAGSEENLGIPDFQGDDLFRARAGPQRDDLFLDSLDSGRRLYSTILR